MQITRPMQITRNGHQYNLTYKFIDKEPPTLDITTPATTVYNHIAATIRFNNIYKHWVIHTVPNLTTSGFKSFEEAFNTAIEIVDLKRHKVKTTEKEITEAHLDAVQFLEKLTQ